MFPIPFPLSDPTVLNLPQIQGDCVFGWLTCQKNFHLNASHIAWGSFICIWIFIWLFLFFTYALSYYKVITRMCTSTDINFPKVSSRHVVASIIVTLSVATSRNYPMMLAAHKCCVVLETILSNIIPDMSPLTIICPCRTILSQSWVIAIHTDKGVRRVWHLIFFSAEISHHFCTFVVQSRSDVECCSFFFFCCSEILFG